MCCLTVKSKYTLLYIMSLQLLPEILRTHYIFMTEDFDFG